MALPPDEQDLKPGDRVVLISTGECGVVVHAWLDQEIATRDCYVAFFGDEFPQPNHRPQKIPYVLRYASTSLRRAL